MKQFKIKTILLLLSVFFSFFACQPDDNYGGFTPEDENLSFSPNDISVSKSGGDYSINIASNLPWRAETSTAWISLTTARGEGDGTLEYKVASNTTIEARTGEIEVYITKENKMTIAVSQEAGDLPPDTAQNIYVKPNGTGDGSSWNNAASMEQALTMETFHGDNIHLAAGVYKPTLPIGNSSSGDDNELTFEINKNLKLIGGYSANPTAGEVPNPEVNETIFSGLLDSGIQVNHVVTISAPKLDEQSVLLYGITIKEGYANGSGTFSINGTAYPNNYAGGIIMANAVVEIEHCVIAENKATAHGVGMYVFGTTELTVLNTQIVANQGATSNGAGMYINSATATFVNSSFENNTTDGVGGAIQTYGSSNLYMYNCTISNNIAGVNGTAGRRAGGIYNRDSSHLVLVNSTVYGNSATGLGGGIHTHGASIVDIISSTITANSGIGGGLNNTAGCTINVKNSIVSGNLEDGAVSDIFGTVAYTYSVIGTNVYGNSGAQLIGEVFDYTTMLGALADNGGSTLTCALTGTTNPAVDQGMNTTQLQVLGYTFDPNVPEAIITKDQTGNSRSGSPDIGAVIR